MLILLSKHSRTGRTSEIRRKEIGNGMKTITIMTGSEHGAADFAGATLENALISLGHSVEIDYKPAMGDLKAVKGGPLLIITSTAGHGELPGNLRPLWRKLQTKRPDLRGLNYAMAVLGDSAYGDHFCLGGKKLDTLLSELGGIRLRQPLLIDSEETNNPEGEITSWGVLLASEVAGLAA